MDSARAGGGPRAVELSVHFFDTFAPEYERWCHGLHRRVAERLAELALARPGDACLDVGCGTGLVTNAIARLVVPGGQVIGLDVSEGMLSVARASEVPNASYQNMTADDQLWFRDGSFDLVTFCDALAYMADPFRSLEEARRVLRHGGRIALALRWRSLDTVAQEVFFRMLDRITEDHPVIIPQQRDSRGLLGEPQVIRQVLIDAGFRQPWTSALVTGDRLRSASDWLDFMAWTGPRSYALLSTLVPRQRQRLERELETEMHRLGEDAFRHHQAYTFAGASV